MFRWISPEAHCVCDLSEICPDLLCIATDRFTISSQADRQEVEHAKELVIINFFKEITVSGITVCFTSVLRFWHPGQCGALRGHSARCVHWQSCFAGTDSFLHQCITSGGVGATGLAVHVPNTSLRSLRLERRGEMWGGFYKDVNKHKARALRHTHTVVAF